jgi:hypothetical protein
LRMRACARARPRREMPPPARGRRVGQTSPPLTPSNRPQQSSASPLGHGPLLIAARERPRTAGRVRWGNADAARRCAEAPRRRAFTPHAAPASGRRSLRGGRGGRTRPRRRRAGRACHRA